MENTSPSFTLKGQWWYPLTTQDIEISTDIAALLCLRPCLSKRLTRFLLFHNQLLIINSNQWKSIKPRRIGEWLYIFIDWLSQSISINRFLWIILIEINDLFSLICIVYSESRRSVRSQPQSRYDHKLEWRWALRGKKSRLRNGKKRTKRRLKDSLKTFAWDFQIGSKLIQTNKWTKEGVHEKLEVPYLG